MLNNRPIVLSIAGFDPSGGAGILADIKTFEQHKVNGFGACTALTCQNDSEFHKLEWVDDKLLFEQISTLINKFEISAVKIGIFKSLSLLKEVILQVKKAQKEVKIVVDPVLKATAGFIIQKDLNPDHLKFIIENSTVITPNYNELCFLEEVLNANVTQYGNILIKGGHNPERPGIDILFENKRATEITSGVEHVFQKHGSGCVLSSSIAARLALGYNLLESCQLAKTYTETFLNSNSTLLGYHNL